MNQMQQEGNLCAQHCLNALLQGPYFTAIDLAELASQLDQKEQHALGNFGSGSGDIKSQNMDDSGFFSVQVFEQLSFIIIYVYKTVDKTKRSRSSPQ